MTNDERLLAKFKADNRASHAAKMSDSQLQANIDCYRSSASGSGNWLHREACLAEQARRHTA